MSKWIYLDNAATSFPKPFCLLAAMERYLQEPSWSPYRFRAIAGESVSEIDEARKALALCLGVEDPDKISFTYNATYAINMLLKGFLRPQDHVIISNYEHNAVVRPLHQLNQSRQVAWDTWSSDQNGLFDLQDLEKLIQPATRLIFLSHASNVLGTVLPLERVAEIAQRRGIALGVDCTQTAGHLPIEADRLKIDLLAGTGHKALLGPAGVGYLYVREADQVNTLIEGGGGFLALSEDPPSVSPHKFEPGTLNYGGIAGLGESLRWLRTREETLRREQQELLAYLLDQLSRNEKVVIYGTRNLETKIPLVSFNVKGCFCSHVEEFLRKKFHIITRSGLHCAPLMHKHLGTLPQGALRVSLGPFNTDRDVDLLMKALSELNFD